MAESPDLVFRVEHAEFSDLGMRRANNQDAITAVAPEKRDSVSRGHLFIVADGMGAHAAGELASKMTVDAVPHAYYKLADLPAPAALRQAVHTANELIHAKGQSSPDFHGMGTTCCCLAILQQTAFVAHVGDSRTYRLRDKTLEQLTFDHSLVWEMAAASETPAEEMPSCIPKNVITRSLGPHALVNVDLEGPHELADRDTFLSCSDGLTGVVEDELIGAILGSMEIADAGRTLVDLANLRGGPDNISVIICRVYAQAASETEANEDSEADSDVTPRDEKVLSPRKLIAWLSLAACLLATGWFASQSQVLPTVGMAAGTAALAVMAFRGPQSTPASQPAKKLEGPYGNGPYRTFSCGSSKSAAESIAAVVAELADIEQHPNQPPRLLITDWKQFHKHRSEAESASEPAEAIRAYGAAIRCLMDQVRNDSTVISPQADSVV